MKTKYNPVVNNVVLYDINILKAETFFERFKGLMFSSAKTYYGLLFENCSSIHTCFMFYKLDVFCLNKNFEVIKIYKKLSPFRFIFPHKNVCHILEIPSWLNCDITLGSKIELLNILKNI